jgi:hypothetical protein
VDFLSILLIVVVIVAVGAVAAVAAVQTGLLSSWALPAPAMPRGRKANRRAPRFPAEPPDGEPDQSGNGAVTSGGPARETIAERSAVAAAPAVSADDWRDELRSTQATAERWFATLQRGFDERSEVILRRLEELARESARERDRLDRLADSAQARHDAAVDRLRTELLAPRDQGEWLGERRAEMAAELYLRLARLEAAIAAVTNPILLPGEPYAPPSEFMAEALVWDNWKDVGERAFAFADTFSSRRLYLSEGTKQEVAGFVTKLRGLLTRSIYPNLRPDPAPTQVQALRAALDELAAELPRLRATLEAEFRAATQRPDATA